jgi:hypothetical protein
MKLAYLIDVGFKKITGKTFTGFTFQRYLYGPFTQEIYRIIDTLLSSGYLILGESLAVDGKSIYKIQKPLSYDGLSEKDLTLLNQLLQEVINLNALQLTQLAYKTAPMVKLGATLGGNENLTQELDFDTIEQVKAK